MAAAPVFELVAQALEEITDLDRLEARGTLRLALRRTGLEPATATAMKMLVVLERVMPGELSSRGVDHAEEVCGEIARRLKHEDVDPGRPETTPADMFRRIREN